MSRRIAGFLAFLLITSQVFYIQPVLAAKGITGSLKIINLYLHWQMRTEDLPTMAKWDVIVLDADQQARYPDRVKELRRLNPNIKILAYIAAEEIADARFSEPSDYPFAKMSKDIQNSWYLLDPNGNKTYFWPGSALLNVTDLGPSGYNGERWNEYLPRFIKNEIMSSGLWDGVFLDNTFDSISYFAKSSVDANRDGRADSKTEVDQAWRNGMNKMLRLIREQSPKAMVIGNGGAVYADRLDGVFFEHFPSYSWEKNWQEFREALAKNRKPAYTSINVNTDNLEKPNDYRLMRYGLGSAIVGGGYYSFDKGDYNHHMLWWYDEYDVFLGQSQSEPRIFAAGAGTAIKPAVWGRLFERGLVLVNSTNKTQKLTLPGTYEKIRGAQDKTVNDGSIVNSVILPPFDGLVLMKRSDPNEINSAFFQNGSFLKSYDVYGRQVRGGFFAQRSDVPNGSQIISTDLDQNGVNDLIYSEKSMVTIIDDQGKRNVFYPFGKSFTGKLLLSVGNVDRDNAQEIVVGAEGVSPPLVKIFTKNGILLKQWEAYVKHFIGGAKPAIGDLDGDGLREIVTAAGPGGGPHIRIWKTDGSSWGGSFFAFDANERGGVSVAVGDVDGDKKDEIITGSGQGAIPRVRVYNGQGRLKSEMTLGTKPLIGGLQVSVADMDQNGVFEILVSGLPIF